MKLSKNNTHSSHSFLFRRMFQFILMQAKTIETETPGTQITVTITRSRIEGHSHMFVYLVWFCLFSLLRHFVFLLSIYSVRGKQQV